MRASRFNSLRQLAAVMAGFAVTILLLESEALATWADRLDVGPARSAAVRATAELDKTLAPLGVEQVRRESLDGLDRLGWSDDPARLLAARERLAGGDHSACISATRTPSPAVPKMPTASAAKMPVPAGVPRITPLTPLPPAAQGQPRVVALVGDSMMAVGLSDILLRETAGDHNLHVIRAFKSGTGLARPDVFDWMQEYPAMIGNEKPDAVIVAIGANDGQGFTEDGKTIPFGSEAWVRVYQQRTADFLNLLTQNGAHVVWVGLPPMKAGAYNDRAAEINRIAYSVVSRNPQAAWWNPQPFIGDEAGGFREMETLPGGRLMRIRAADGIHLSDDGAALLAPALMAWLNPVAQAQTAQMTPQERPTGNTKRGLRARTARP